MIGAFQAGVMSSLNDLPIIVNRFAGRADNVIGIPTADQQSGDVLVVIARAGINGTANMQFPAGWQEIGRIVALGESVIFSAVVGAPISSVTITSAAARLEFALYHLRRCVRLSASIGSSSDPPSHTAAWSGGLAIAGASWLPGSSVEATLPPSGYQGLMNGNNGGTTTGFSGLCSAHRYIAANSENPGVFTFSGSLNREHGYTIIAEAA